MSSKWQIFFDFKIRLFQWKFKNVAYRDFTVDSGWDSSSAIVCKHELEICNLLIKQCRYYTLGWQVDGCEDSSCIKKYLFIAVIDNHLYFDFFGIYILEWIDLKDLELQRIWKTLKNLKSMQAKKHFLCWVPGA